MAAEFDPTKVSKEHWGHALTHVIISGSQSNPTILYNLVAEGEQTFVKAALKTDRYGLTARVYSDVFKRLARTVKRWQANH